MALAAVYNTHEDKLRADLQQFYGIDLDHAMAGGHTPYHIACLATQLPQQARVIVNEDPDYVWGLNETLLASLLNALNGLIWGMGDKRKRGPKPTLVGPSRMTEGQKRSLPARVLPLDKLMEELSKPRR